MYFKKNIIEEYCSKILKSLDYILKEYNMYLRISAQNNPYQDIS